MLGQSMRTDIRSEIIKLFRDLLNTHVHGDAEAFSDLVDDLLESKKWTSLFGISRQTKIKTSQAGFSLHWSMSTNFMN